MAIPHQGSYAGGTLETKFRSKTPRAAMQEAYALFSSYNMIRATMQAAAAAHNLSPQHPSFMDTLRVISPVLPRRMGAKGAQYQAMYDQSLRDIAECRGAKNSQHPTRSSLDAAHPNPADSLPLLIGRDDD